MGAAAVPLRGQRMKRGTAANYDIFVSYAHADDADVEIPWVRRFVGTLTKKVSTLLRRDANFFFDERIEVGTDVPRELLDGVNASRILMVILSPRYLASPWCRTELAGFLDRRHPAKRSILVIEAERIDR